MLRRLIINTDKKCLFKFVYNFGVKGAIGINRFKRRVKKGNFFPAFHFISVTDDCNLRCQGCWVTGKKQNNRLSGEQLEKIIMETKSMGSFFFGILGGEPLLYKPLFEIFKKHSDCYFLLFTNGTLLTPEVSEKLRKLGNVSPLISFEGDEQNADTRRGGKNIYDLACKAIENASSAGLITGTAISVCKSNFEMAVSPQFIKFLIDKGVFYLWYYIYRPVGENASADLALSAEEIQQLHSFIIRARSEFDVAIIDAYWDNEGKGLCPAATGLSHHINASGYVEPCPVIQFSTDNINDKSLKEIYGSSAFLKNFKTEVLVKTNGCVLMEDPAWLIEFIERNNAMDTSGRDNEVERLRSMKCVSSHATGIPIPERKGAYKFAKKFAFFGFGAYG